MKHEMNLLPVHPPKKRSKNVAKRKGWMLILGLIVVLAGISGTLVFLDFSCQNEIKQIEAVINNRSKYQVIYTNLADQKEVLEYRTHIQESINQDKDLPLKALDVVHKALPDEVSVSNYIFQDGFLRISGQTQNNEAILEFKEKLTALDFFKVINMVNTSKKQVTYVDNKNPVNEEVWEFTFDIEMNEVS